MCKSLANFDIFFTPADVVGFKNEKEGRTDDKRTKTNTKYKINLQQKKNGKGFKTTR